MAVTKQNISLAALDALIVNNIDLGGTFAPLVVSMEIAVQEIGTEYLLMPVDCEITSRTLSAQVTLAEITLANLSIIYNLPIANIVSSSLTIDSGDRGMLTWIAIGKTGSSPNDGTRTFNFSRSRAVGTFSTNMAKLEATNLPVEFRFYADRTTGVAGTITDSELLLMPYDTTRSGLIALDGDFTSESLYTAVDDLAISLVRIIYDEATSVDDGVDIRIGKIGDPDYFATFTSEILKSAGSVTIVTLTNTGLLANETLTVECDGGKSGTGAIKIQIELERQQ